jgi:hypothetical protein
MNAASPRCRRNKSGQTQSPISQIHDLVAEDSQSARRGLGAEATMPRPTSLERTLTCPLTAGMVCDDGNVGVIVDPLGGRQRFMLSVCLASTLCGDSTESAGALRRPKVDATADSSPCLFLRWAAGGPGRSRPGRARGATNRRRGRARFLPKKPGLPAGVMARAGPDGYRRVNTWAKTCLFRNSVWA